MKKILLMMFLSVVLCLGMAGCGGGSEAPEAEAPVAESVAGDWECIDMTMTEGDAEMAKDDLEELFGAKVEKLAHLTAYADGTGNMLLLEETMPLTWVEADKGYTLTVAGDDAGAPMTAVLADNQLSVESKEGDMKMSFTFKYLGKTSVLIDGWDLQLTDEEVVEMSSFMAWGESIVVDDMLYGSFGGNTWEDGSFSAAKVKKDGVGDRAVMAEGVRASTLTEHDGYIYGAFGNAEIIKVEAGLRDEYNKLYMDIMTGGSGSISTEAVMGRMGDIQDKYDDDAVQKQIKAELSAILDALVFGWNGCKRKYMGRSYLYG